MQLVRVLEPRPRTLASKVVEALRAVQLEARLGKREILAAYLTFAPYGGNLEGVEAACWAYFGHGARDLVPEEIATLLAVPQQPGARAPSPRNGERADAARAAVAARLVAAGALPAAGVGPASWARGADAAAAVAAARAARGVLAAGAVPGRERIATTLDRGGAAARRAGDVARGARDGAARHPQRRGGGRRPRERRGAGAGRQLRLLGRRARRPDRRLRRRALAGLGAQAVHLRARHRPRAGAARAPGARRAGGLRQLHAAELRRPLRRAGVARRRAVAVAQRAVRPPARPARARAFLGTMRGAGFRHLGRSPASTACRRRSAPSR